MTRPEIKWNANFLPGLAAIGLFVVLAVAFLNVSLPEPTGYGGDAEIIRSIGAALFDIDPAAVTSDGAAVASEGFLATFIIIAIVLDAALDGSLVLAKRETPGDIVSVGSDTEVESGSGTGPTRTDGGTTDDEGGDGS